MSNISQYSIFIAGSKGQIKACNFQQNTWDRLSPIDGNEISCLCWQNENETDVLIGKTNQDVITLSDKASLSLPRTEDAKLVGLCEYNSGYVTCTNTGVVSYSLAADISYSAGANVVTMRQNTFAKHLTATGGQDNHLKIWDLSANSEKPIFMGKNQKNDWLNLPVPTWISDIAFADNCRTIYAASNYNKIEIYDVKAQRRPVTIIPFGDSPITSISLLPNQHQVVVGNTKGHTALIDVRGKGKMVHQFNKANGGVTKLKSDGKIVSVCSMDRYFRIYDVNSKLLLYKAYLKTTPVDFLVRRDFGVGNGFAVEGVYAGEKRKLGLDEGCVMTTEEEDMIIEKKLKNF